MDKARRLGRSGKCLEQRGWRAAGGQSQGSGHRTTGLAVRTHRVGASGCVCVHGCGIVFEHAVNTAHSSHPQDGGRLVCLQAFTLCVYGRVLECVHHTLCRCIFLASRTSSRGTLCVHHNPIIRLFCSALFWSLSPLQTVPPRVGVREATSLLSGWTRALGSGPGWLWEVALEAASGALLTPTVPMRDPGPVYRLFSET